MNKPTYIKEALRRIDSEIFAEPNQMKIILQKELQGLGERIEKGVLDMIHEETKTPCEGARDAVIEEVVQLIRSLTLPNKSN